MQVGLGAGILPAPVQIAVTACVITCLHAAARVQIPSHYQADQNNGKHSQPRASRLFCRLAAVTALRGQGQQGEGDKVRSAG